MKSKFFLYLFFLALVVSCSSTSTITEINPQLLDNNTHLESTILENRLNFIDSYISKIDFNSFHRLTNSVCLQH